MRMLLLLGGGYLLFKYLQRRKEAMIPAQTVEPLPTGAVFTGNTQRTTNAGGPGEEVVGYGVRDWAEIKLPTGHTGWVEVRQG